VHSISAFFPAYNDAGSIEKLVHATALLLPWLSEDFEIVVVDDGSTDATAELLGRLQRQYPSLKVIHHGVNRGYGAALITGFANCSKDLIFYTDGDGQYDVGELPELLEALDDDVEMVTGYKIQRSDPGYRILTGRIYRDLVRIMFGLKVKDVDCDFRLFRRRILERIQLTCDSGVICVELIKKCRLRGYRIVEIPVHHYHRAFGQSQFFSPKHLSRVLVQLLVTWFKLVMKGQPFRSPAIPDQPYTLPRELSQSES
jgi:glycosyltransferase involved in cell wall biosynthesis